MNNQRRPRMARISRMPRWRSGRYSMLQVTCNFRPCACEAGLFDYAWLKTVRPAQQLRTWGRNSLAAGLMLVLFLGLQVVTASSALHQWLHPQSASPDHQCVITLVSHG